jgi:hypothetical protein
MSEGLALHENVRLQVSNTILKITERLLLQKMKIAPTLDAVLLKNFIEAFGEHVLMLMPQEIYVSRSKRERVDAVFGGIIAFDYKSYEAEFKEAAKKAEQEYLPKLPKAKYYVITNWNKWAIYNIEKGQMKNIYAGDRASALVQLENIIAGEVKELKIPPFPKNIEGLFSFEKDAVLDDLKKVFEFSRDNPEVRPLFESYKKIMETLYSEATGAELKGLFIKHTLMHMISMACLTKVFDVSGDPIEECSGALISSGGEFFDVGLPYLNWWKVAFHTLGRDLEDVIRKICRQISARASLLDWELGGAEDVFRGLYEVLVEPETRRKIGEYYTPIWLVDRLLCGFKLREKFVLDPFCGSGTFLVRSFYKKLEEGEPPEEAYEELVGLDINPLAVAIARAELINAYRKIKGERPPAPPRVYHADTLAAWFGGSSLMLEDPEYLSILNIVESYVSAEASFELKKQVAQSPPRNLVRSLSNIEQALATGIRLATNLGTEGLEDRLKKRVLEMLNKDNPIEAIFKEVVGKTTFTDRLAALIRKYGNGVWATTIVSALIPAVIKEFKPDIIVTNPPWVQVTKYRSQHISKIREEGIKLLQKAISGKKRCASLVTGSDVACMALHRAIHMAKEGVGFVMNREQSFYSASPMRAGILLTYMILNEWVQKGRQRAAELIDVDYNAFGHGIYPALVRAWQEGSK